MYRNCNIFWQNLQSYLDPVIFSWGSFSLRWYSLSYLLAFLTVYLIILYRLKKERASVKRVGLNEKKLDQLFLWLALSVILGGRLGYALFYEPAFFLQHPFDIIWPFSDGKFGLSGMSFHGGLLGVLATGWLFAKKNNLSFLYLANFIVPAVPLGYFWGRIGNFLNGELYGRVTASKMGMYFPADATRQLRHPSQLYEALGEGLLIFLILWPWRNHPRLKNRLLWLYLILYGLIRFGIEFFRQPDLHLGLLWLNLSLGQWLCLGMIAVGLFFFNFRKIFGKAVK